MENPNRNPMFGNDRRHILSAASKMNIEFYTYGQICSFFSFFFHCCCCYFFFSNEGFPFSDSLSVVCIFSSLLNKCLRGRASAHPPIVLLANVLSSLALCMLSVFMPLFFVNKTQRTNKHGLRARIFFSFFYFENDIQNPGK